VNHAIKNSLISNDAHGPQKEEEDGRGPKVLQAVEKSLRPTKKHNTNTAATKKSSAKIKRTRSEYWDFNAVTVKKTRLELV